MAEPIVRPRVLAVGADPQIGLSKEIRDQIDIRQELARIADSLDQVITVVENLAYVQSKLLGMANDVDAVEAG